MERLIVRVGLVAIANDQADERPLRDRVCVALRERARADLEESLLRAAVDAREQLIRLHLARSRRLRERLLHRPSAHDRDGAEHLGVLEPEARGAVAAHAESVEKAAFAGVNRAVGRVDVRDEVLDDHRLDRSCAVRPVDIHPHLEAVHEHDETGRRPARLDRGIEVPRDRGYAREAASRAVQPVHHGEAPLGVALVGGGGVDVVADCGLCCRALKGAVRDAWRRDRRGDPQHRLFRLRGGG